jgi:acyl-coenzyme A thioesterase PaaI-like protein
MLDFALAFAGLTTCDEGESAVSISLNVNFLGPVMPGAVIVEAILATNGFRIAQAEAKLFGPDGSVLATATSPLAMKRHKKA